MMHDTAMSGGMHLPLLLFAAVIVLSVIAVVAVVIVLRRPAGVDGAIGSFTPSMLTPDGQPTQRAAADSDAIADMIIVIPDISGYTDYMSHSRLSLRHAQYVVGELLAAIAAAARSQLSI